MKLLCAAVVAAPLVFPWHVAPADASVDPVEQALQDEMERSMKKLRLGEEPRPYFLSYRLDDLEVVEVGASFGSPLRRSRERYRVLSAEIRVGSPKRDNTNFFSFRSGSNGVSRSWNGSVRVPVDDDYQQLRRQAWLLTDATYKTALENLARKAAALENRRVPGDLADFVSAETASVSETVAGEPVDMGTAESLVIAVSRVFREHAAVTHSLVRLRSTHTRSRYFNSEGSSFERSVPLVELVVGASGQSLDGTPLADTVAHYGRSLSDLPTVELLVAEAKVLSTRLATSLEGESIERYNGPVLFSGQAAAEVFHQIFAPGLAAWRSPVAEDEQLEGRLAQMNRSLNDRLGGRVLARSMRLTDDPRAKMVEGKRLFGGFDVDDEGVPGRETRLVERGILKGLVAGRSPSRGIERSTGNRRGPAALPSNLLLDTSAGKGEDEILAEMFELMDERDLDFGVVVRRVANPLLVSGFDRGASGAASSVSQGALKGVVEAFKIYRDGRQEPLRDPRFSGFSAASFRDIVAASHRRTVYSAPLRPEHAGVALMSSGTLGSTLAGPAIVSVVVPDLLFEELTIAVPGEPVPRPPVLGHPYFSR
jgi:predicted Zn-dependent protease